MNALLENLCSNRRNQDRKASALKAIYECATGKRRPAELINYSRSGARLTTHSDVKVGDEIRVFAHIFPGHYLSSTARVRWVQALPGGRRQVVGVQALPYSHRIYTTEDISL